MFQCRACLAKDNHILDLKAEIERLSKLVFPSRPTQNISTSDLEADALLSGNQEPIHLTESLDVSREADRFLSGHHDDTEEVI